MTESKHTLEPWKTRTFRVYASGHKVAVALGDTNAERCARAVRIVADHNSLAGLNPEGVRELVETGRAIETSLRAVTLELFMSDFATDAQPQARAITAAADALRAALAKLEGGDE